MKLVFELRREVDQAKAEWIAEKEQLVLEHKRDKEQAVLSARVEAQVACSRLVCYVFHYVNQIPRSLLFLLLSSKLKSHSVFLQQINFWKMISETQ